MTDRLCDVEDCGRSVVSRIWCAKHYQQWYRTGDPLGSKKKPLVERFWDRVDLNGPSGCWLWTGHISPNGYSYWRKSSGHRFAFELLKHPIPDGLQLDHLCRVRHCVNPDHLEPVTPRENVMRSPFTPARINSLKTKCPQGHVYSPENTYTSPEGERGCRICRRSADLAFKARRKEHH